MFITFEGIDGSGKTTQLGLLADGLARSGVDALRTKEPDGGLLGPEVRTLFTVERTRPLEPIEELLLVGAARHDHVGSVVTPALAVGRWVLCDRFVDSTFAYQVFETGVPTALFDAMRDASLGALRPDLTFVLDLDPDVARARLGGRRATAASADPAEARRDFRRIRRGLLLAAAESPGRCRVIDAGASVEVVAARIWEVVRSRM